MARLWTDRWTGTIRVRVGAYALLDRHMQGIRRSHGLKDNYGTRAMRVYNCSSREIGSAIRMLMDHDEPFDAKRPPGVHANGRINASGEYDFNHFRAGNQLDRATWVNQTLFFKQARTRKLLKPGG